jgi:hypothetical protein
MRCFVSLRTGCTEDRSSNAVGLIKIVELLLFTQPGKENIQHTAYCNKGSKNKIEPFNGMGCAACFFPFLVFIELKNIQNDEDDSGSKEQHLEKLDHVIIIY